MRRVLLVSVLVALVNVPGSAWCADVAPSAAWTKIDEDRSKAQSGSVLLAAPDLGRLLLVGATEEAVFVRAYDPAARSWSEVATVAAGKSLPERFHPYYQAAYDPGSKTIYCLSGGPVLCSFSMVEKTWTTHPAAAELDGLSWHAMACDTVGGRLVVVGADKKADNFGWSRTVVYEIGRGKWSPVEVADPKVVEEHRQLVAAKEACIDLAGRIRLAWYRDPKQVGTDEELASLGKRCEALKKLPQMSRFAAAVDAARDLVAARRTLDALKTVRALERQIELTAEQQYPVPPSRRNSPLAFDAKNKLFVLFGGDHEDYLTNDTWALDLDKATWQRRKPATAPSPRAGHALCALGASGKVALYEGYVQSSSTDYGACPYAPLDPRQLWLYDVAADRWDLAGTWKVPTKDDRATPATIGLFQGYASEWFSPPALAAVADNALILAGDASEAVHWRSKRASETWAIAIDPARADKGGRDTLGTACNQRLYRTGQFLAAFCETPEGPKPPDLANLPANRWVRLPAPPRNPCQGCRQRDWGTSVWDSDRDQILLWGGGHCVRSASTVAHYSPASGRIVEGFDADEPYGANGGGGFDSSLLNRAWVSTHNYNHYAYDPKCKLLVSGRGYLYDPERMDWVRREAYPLPFVFGWGDTCVETSAHGAVAWARRKDREQYGLWLFDRERGWVDLDPKGRLFAPYCDAHGMVYDSKRDRMILSGVGGGYEKLSNGTFLAFDFKTHALDTLRPENPEPARTRNARELVYIPEIDWLVIGELYGPVRDEEDNRHLTRVYDCARNKMFLLDTGHVPSGHSTGWMYDARRKLVYVFTYRGEAYAIRFDPATARLVERPES
ncbi:MAG: Kelch repeat-containing protein [Pirellulales bacterium]